MLGLIVRSVFVTDVAGEMDGEEMDMSMFGADDDDDDDNTDVSELLGASAKRPRLANENTGTFPINPPSLVGSGLILTDCLWLLLRQAERRMTLTGSRSMKTLMGSRWRRIAMRWVWLATTTRKRQTDVGG